MTKRDSANDLMRAVADVAMDHASKVSGLHVFDATQYLGDIKISDPSTYDALIRKVRHKLKRKQRRDSARRRKPKY